MKKKILPLLLSLCMIITFMPVNAFADAGGQTTSGKIIISDKTYEIAPDILEREYITNNIQLSAQQMGHVMEVKLGENAQIIAGYNDYNIEAIKSGSNWGMRKTTEQAQAAEDSRKVNVVGAVNGDFFDMSNGKPLGVLVMNGTVIQESNRPCFYIDSDGNPHITSNSSTLPEGVKEAVSGWQILVQDGKALTFNDATTNPRTAVGIRADNTVVFYMVDGRQAPLSVGMTSDEMAQTMVDLGCVEAMHLDGGGSATFATQRAGEAENNTTAGLSLRCSPSDGYERTVSSSILIVSTSTKDGKFDHAILSPNQEVYTPGSTITFTAQGADSAGGPASMPESGLSWEVTEGMEIGSIDQVSGVFTAEADKEGTVTVKLKYNGVLVGESSVEIRWPDKLGFVNSSVSLDFGERSDLTFAPTYQGRSVNYKDGDFKWTVEPQSYKYTTIIETKAPNEATGFAGNGFKDMSISLNGQIDVPQKLRYTGYGTWWNYSTEYKETAKELTYDEDGTVYVTSTVVNTNAWTYTYLKEDPYDPSIITGQEEHEVTRELQADQKITFSIGTLEKNNFIADNNNSLRAKVHATLVNDNTTEGSIDVIVGMEPYVLMDFEDHKNANGSIEAAEEYWTMHVGSSSTGSNGQLTLEEMRNDRIWIRDTTGQKIQWPEGANGLVSSEVDSRVRFGEHACKIGWDFTGIKKSINTAADFGFSAIVYVDAVQPTKLGVWINVPKDLENDNSAIKAILVGNGTPKDSADLAYWKMNDDGTMTFNEGKNITGTTTYFQYFSYNADGSISGSKLSDWAGKGWTWIEADISSLQMPVGVQRAYTIRISSPPNCTKGKGYILIDNLQMIYGTNTNDINNPVIESVVEKSAGVNLKTSESKPIIANRFATFEIPLSDNKQTDKYATGVDVNSIKVFIDGQDYTSTDMISETAFGCNIVFSTPELTNGQHTVKIRVKDYYGNETIESYQFIVDDEAGKPAAVTVQRQDGDAIPGGSVALDIVNNGESAASTAEVTIEVSEAYANAFKSNVSTALVYGECYEQAKDPVVNDGKITVYVQKKVGGSETQGDKSKIATLKFAIPETVRKGESFTYAVPEANYSNGVETETFSLANQVVPYTAAYDIAAGQAIIGRPVDFAITNAAGEKIENITLYDGNGTVLNSNVFTTAGRKTVYAMDDEGNRSWNLDFAVCENGTDGDGSPYGVQNNASKNGATEKSITWLSAIESSKEAAYLKYAKSAENVASAETQSGKSEYITFVESDSGEAYRMNSVKLEGLTPDTTYYYQVGDGEKWSEVLTFTTATDAKNGDTNFFIFGDIQSNSTSKVTAAISKITGADKKFDFGIQTGDAIDDVTKFANWRSYLTTVNAQKLSGIDLFHALGNHEYYGDADGITAGNIFALSRSGAGSFYSAEYGSVYVAVVNNGGNLSATIGEVQSDAQKSDCIWKVLVIHEPIYGTESEMDSEARKEIVSMIGEAGIDFVFTGDDHAYARTYPIVNDEIQAEDSRTGTVFYVCGDLSDKNNTYNTHDYFVKSIAHDEYQGMYMTAEADNNKITINAYDYSGNLLDSYTESRTNCEVGNHTFDETSLYNLENKTLNCTVCGVDVPAKDSGYTGKLKTSGNEGEVVLVAGTLKTGWFTLGEDILHAGDDGLLHKSQTVDTATCLENGYLKSVCECSEVYQGNATWAKGHTWDENHICTVCGAKGISMEDVTLSLNGKYWEYTGSNIRASVNATYGVYKLVASSDRYGTDAYRTYSNNKDVGMGTVTFEGRGNFYGSKSIQFPIVPKSVTEITADQVFSTSAIVKWDAAPGAGYYRVYRKTENGWTKVGVTKNTSIIIQDLKPETEYTFRVASSTDVDGKTFNCLHWSNELTVKTGVKGEALTEEALANLSAVMNVNGNTVELPMINADGEKYLMLPANADLKALQLNLGLEDESPSVTFIGSAGNQETIGNKVEADIYALTGNADGTSQDIMLMLPDCEPMTIHVMKSKNISAVYLTSDDPVSQGREFVDSSKSNETTAKMTMVAANGSIVYDGNLTQVKARGNSTFTYYDKKSYQIKLSSKTDLLGTGEQVKTWVLLAGYGDATQMHDKLIKDLAAEMGMPYVASCDWIDLYYDGQYRGTYLLSEKNSVNDTGVVITDMEDKYSQVNEGYGDNPQIATETNAFGQSYQYTAGLTEPENITGGYLIERNLNTIDEASGFHTRQGGGFNVKSPEYAGNEAMKYISEYYQEFEDAVYAQDEEGNYTGYNAETGKHYYDYCDRDSLVKVFLLQDLALNPDGFLSSFYFYKDADDVMYAGPIWDQEMAFGTGFTIKISPDITNYHYLAEALIQIPDFKAAVEAYYESTFKDLVQGLVGDNGVVAGYQDKIEASTSMNYVLWPYVNIGSPDAENHLWTDGTTYTDVVADMQQWLGRRLNKLNVLYGDGELHTEHIYTSKVTKEPTYTEEGIRTFTCTVCGDTYTEVIPKLTMPSGGGGGAIAPVVPPDGQDAYKKEAVENIISKAEENKYDAEEQKKIDQIVAAAKEKIEAAKTEEQVQTIEQESEDAIEAIDTAAEKAEIKEIQSIGIETFKARSKKATLNGKKAIRVTWNNPSDIDFDGYEIYRSMRKNSGYKYFFTAKAQKYTNNKNIKEGKTYYYRVRAFKTVNGRNIYTGWSTKAWRTIK